MFYWNLFSYMRLLIITPSVWFGLKNFYLYILKAVEVNLQYIFNSILLITDLNYK